MKESLKVVLFLSTFDPRLTNYIKRKKKKENRVEEEIKKKEGEREREKIIVKIK